MPQWVALLLLGLVGIAVYANRYSAPLVVLWYDRAIALKPDDAQAYHDRAIVYYLRKRYDKAWSDVTQFRPMGGTANPSFIQALAKDSVRSE